MKLEEYLDPMAAEIAFWLMGLRDPEYIIEQLGSLSESLSEKLRSLAIITLLAEADTNLFYHNLIRSGLAREIFLKRCQAEGFTDYHLAISRNGALFDCITAGSFDVANRIDRLSPVEWIADGEYEDDYCFMRFFHLIIRDGMTQTELIPVLERFEASLEGVENAKLGVCRALAYRDQRTFDDSFDGLILEHETAIREDTERGQMEDEDVVAQRQIFIEGLAILRIAERIGLKTEPEYKYCPAIARLPMTIPFPGE